MCPQKIKRIKYNLFQNSQEKYVPKKEEIKAQPFGGQAVSVDTTKSVGLGIKEVAPPKVEEGKDKTKVNIRLHTGKMINFEVNSSAPVSVIYDYIAKYYSKI